MSPATEAHAPIRPCRSDEHATMLDIINSAAVAYRGVIPSDCWHEPYMSAQQLGIGSTLLEHLKRSTTRRILVGTWAGAEWAIRFYQRHGFETVSDADKVSLLTTYWSIPDRQIETSVVLTSPPVRVVI